MFSFVKSGNLELEHLDLDLSSTTEIYRLTLLSLGFPICQG